jgi:hypothetical protein
MPRKKPRRNERRSPLGRRPLLERLEDRTLLTFPSPAFPQPSEIFLATGRHLNGVVATDLNHDGKMDLVVSDGNYGLEVFLGNGNGTFQNYVTYPFFNEISQLTLADVTDNGNPDLVTNSQSGVNVVLINPDGSLQNPLATGLSGSDVVVGDFTGDGKQDLAVAGTQGISVAAGDGDGTFEQPILTTLATRPTVMIAGDFNGDGKLDLVVDNTAGQLDFFAGNGDGTFQQPVLIASSVSVNSMAVGDLSGDGKLDLVTTDGNQHVDVWAGNGNGTFQNPVSYLTSSQPGAVTLADLSGNGRLDIITANSAGYSLSVLLNNGDGSFGPATSYNVAGNAAGVAVGDFHGDGKLDLATVDSGVNGVNNLSGVSLLTGNGDGTFQDSYQTPVGANGPPDRIAQGDLNGDGLADIVTTDPKDNGVTVVLNNGHGGFGAPTFYSTGPGSDPQGLALADLSGNGKLDLVVADTGTNSVSVFMGNGDGTFQAPVDYPTGGTYPTNVAVGDVNGDGTPDIVVINNDSNDVSVLLGNGDGTFASPATYPDGATAAGGVTAGSSIVLADFNGDGKLDIAAENPVFGVSVLLNNGDGSFGSPALYTFEYQNGITDLTAADLTGDGVMDLVVAGGYGLGYVMLGNGDGAFTTSTIYDTPPSPAYGAGAVGVAVADFNGDGIPDLVFGSSGGQLAFLQGNGDGTFQPNVWVDAGPDPAYLTVGDFDGDGLPDVAAADQGSPGNFGTAYELTVLESGGNPVAAGDHLSLTGSTQVSPGAPFTLTIRAYTASGVIDPDYTGTVELTSTDPDAVLPPAHTFTAADGGSYAFTLTLNTDGSQTVTATDTGSDPAVPFSDSVVVGQLTPVFAPEPPLSIVYGTASVTVTGHLNGNGSQNIPAGEDVYVTLGSVTQAAPLDANDNFSTTFNTGQLPPTSTPYSLTFLYNGYAKFAAATGTGGGLSVTPAATTSGKPAPATAVYGASDQAVTLDGSVFSSTAVVNGGVLTFTVVDTLGDPVGAPVTSDLVAGGLASATFTLPAGTPAGVYTVEESYDGSADFLPSKTLGTGTLTVQPGASSVTVPEVDVASSSSDQTLTLSATVLGPVGDVNDGTFTFTVFDAGNNIVGAPVVSGTVSSGVASAGFTLPANQAAGMYTIEAVYSGDANLLAGSGSGTLGVDAAPSLAPIGGTNQLSAPSDQFPLTVPLSGSSTIDNPLNFTATAAGDNPLFDLEQQYQFTGVGYVTAGAPAYVLHSSQSGPGVAGYYLLSPSGGLYAYDGSGSYAHTFANSANLVTTLAPGIYTDPTQLLNAAAPVDYTTLYNLEQQYQFTGLGYFTAGAPAYVLHSSRPGPGVLGYYLLSPDGDLFPYDGSGSYAGILTGSSPLATPGPGVYSDPAELTGAGAPAAMYPELYSLKQEYDLQELGGSFYTNTLGNGAQWLYSPIVNQFGQHWYTLTMTANNSQALLTAWQGYADSSVGAVVATLDPSVYSNPAWLTSAVTPPDPTVPVGVNSSGDLSIGLPGAGYTGSFKVTITASDGLLSSSETAVVTVTDTAPTVTVQQNGTTIPQGGSLTVNHGSLPLTFAVGATGATGKTVTTSATASSYSLPFSLQQQYQFRGLGYFTAGATAYVLTAANNNSFGNPYYLLSSSGSLYAYDGSGSYAHTFANVTALANLGANTYADPTLLTNAQAPVDYPTLYNLMQQYQFTGLGYYTADATAYVLHSNQAGPGVGGYYLLRADGTLAPYDGSGSYAFSFENENPVAHLDPAVYADPAELLNATAAPSLYPQLNQAEQQYDLQELGGSFYTGSEGNAAKWLYSPVANANGQHWYTLVLSSDGTRALLYAWNGGSNSVPAGSTPVATFDPSVYADPTLLTNAKAPLAAVGVTATLSGGMLTVNAPAPFAGTFEVTLKATDGSLSTTQSFQVISTDKPPVPAAIGPQTVSQASPLQLSLSAADAENDPVSFTAQSAGYSAAYNLQQVYHFSGVGFITNGGVTAYVMRSSVLGGVGGYYLLSSTGGVYAYDGSGSYAHTFANSANLITTLDPSVYTTPTLLTNAQPPVLPAAVVNISGSTLTVNVASVPVGTVFEVFVTASDGAETTRTGFLVTVTA